MADNEQTSERTGALAARLMRMSDDEMFRAACSGGQARGFHSQEEFFDAIRSVAASAATQRPDTATEEGDPDFGEQGEEGTT